MQRDSGRTGANRPPICKTGNWSARNEAFKRRGSLTICFDPTMNWGASRSGKRGRQWIYSDSAIQTCLTVKLLFGMALRQIERRFEYLLDMRSGLVPAPGNFT